MTLQARLEALATRVAAEIKAVRAEMGGGGGTSFSTAPKSGWAIGPRGVETSSATGALVRNKLVLIAVEVKRSGITPLGFRYQLATAAAGGAAVEVRLCLYDSDSLGWPDTDGGPIAQAVADLATPAIKSTPFITPLGAPLPVGLYWFGGLYTYTTVPTTVPVYHTPSATTVELPYPSNRLPGTTMRGLALDGVTSLPTTAQTAWVGILGNEGILGGIYV